MSFVFFCGEFLQTYHLRLPQYLTVSKKTYKKKDILNIDLAFSIDFTVTHSVFQNKTYCMGLVWRKTHLHRKLLDIQQNGTFYFTSKLDGLRWDTLALCCILLGLNGDTGLHFFVSVSLKMPNNLESASHSLINEWNTVSRECSTPLSSNTLPGGRHDVWTTAINRLRESCLLYILASVANM